MYASPAGLASRKIEEARVFRRMFSACNASAPSIAMQFAFLSDHLIHPYRSPMGPPSSRASAWELPDKLFFSLPCPLFLARDFPCALRIKKKRIAAPYVRDSLHDAWTGPPPPRQCHSNSVSFCFLATSYVSLFLSLYSCYYLHSLIFFAQTAFSLSPPPTVMM